MRGETAGSNHCSATWLAQLVHIINPNHHLAKASTYPPHLPPHTPARLPASLWALIRHYSTMADCDQHTLNRHANKHLNTCMQMCMYTNPNQRDTGSFSLFWEREHEKILKIYKEYKKLSKTNFRSGQHQDQLHSNKDQETKYIHMKNKFTPLTFKSFYLNSFWFLLNKHNTNHMCKWSQTKTCRTDSGTLSTTLGCDSCSVSSCLHVILLPVNVLVADSWELFHLATSSTLTHSWIGHSGLDLFKLWNRGAKSWD